MNPTHKGKIGRLPRELREQVNRRLDDGERGTSIIAWLNTVPEVQALLAAEFKDKPIGKENLSHWRKYGYKKWLWRQEAQTMAAKTEDLSADGAPPLLDQMKTWAAVRYLVAMQQAIAQNGIGKPTFNLLRGFCRDVVALQRNELTAGRLNLTRQHLAARILNVPLPLDNAGNVSPSPGGEGRGKGELPIDAPIHIPECGCFADQPLHPATAQALHPLLSQLQKLSPDMSKE